MDKDTHIAAAIRAVKGDPRLDRAVKELLADKQILARILKRTVSEFSDCDIPDIMEAIEGKPIIEKVPIEPGLTNSKGTTDVIVGDNTESNILNENTYYFDIRFHAIAGGKENGKDNKELIKCGIKLIMDVEAQLDYYVGYDIVTRGIYYASRLVSSQYGTEFTGDDFGGIKKVYSIWICMKPPAYGSNSIVNFKLTPEIIYGKFPPEKIDEMRHDLIDIVLVYISGKQDEEKDELCGMLELLLDKDIEKEEKLKTLENDYKIERTRAIETEVVGMSDYSASIYIDGMQEGIQQGVQQGIRQGIQQGVKQGIRQGIQQGVQQGMQTGQNLLVKAIQMLKENKSDEEILAADIDERTLELAKACR